MSRKHNTTHPERSLSGYSVLHKNVRADRYGQFQEGKQVTPDRIAGKTVYYADKKEKK